MPREKDTRDFTRVKRIDTDEEKQLSAMFSERVGGDNRLEVQRFNPLTGTARLVNVESSPPQEGSLVQRALDYVTREAKQAFGFESDQQPEFVPDAYTQETSGNRAIVTLQQRYRGIPIFLMNRSVQFKDRTTIDRVEGNTTSIIGELDTLPRIDAATAVKIAADYLSQTNDEEKVDHWGQKYTAGSLEVPANYEPRVLATFDSPSQPTTLDRGPFGDDPKAVLNFFDQGATLRLVWNITVTLPDHAAQYLMLVAADRPFNELVKADDFVLWCKNIISSQVAAVTANVFTHNPGIAQRQTVTFPLPPHAYPISSASLPNPFPSGWWVKKDETIGNCTVAVKGKTTVTLKGVNNGTSLSFGLFSRICG
jgi:hypothetical protein